VKPPRHGPVYILSLVAFCLLCIALMIRSVTAMGPAIIARVAVGMYPSAVAIDGVARRALVLNSYDTTVSVLDEGTGALLATTTVGSNGGAHPQQVALDTRTGHAVVLTDDGQASVLDTRSGHVLNAVLLSGSPAAIVIDEGQARAFVAEADAGVVAIVDTRSGALLRTVPVGRFPEEIVCDSHAHLVFVASQGDSVVNVLDARTGRSVRTLRTAVTPNSLAVSDRYHELFIAGMHGSITGVDVYTGTRRFQRTLSSSPGTAFDFLLAVDDARGTLLAAHDTHIQEIDPSTGRSRSLIRLPSAITALGAIPGTGDVMATVRGAVDARGQVLGDGSLLLFNARGQRLDTIPVGVDPSALAVDPVNGRVLVADTNLNPDGSPVPPRPAPTPPLTRLLSALRTWLPFLPSVTPARAPVRSTTGAVDVLRLDLH